MMVRKIFDLPEGTEIPVFVENEPQRVMFELGPLGFLVWYALRIMLIIALWRTHTKCRVPLYRELALTGCLVHLIGFPGQMVFQITFLVYYWFLAGFIFLLPRLERIEMLEMEDLDERGAVA